MPPPPSPTPPPVTNTFDTPDYDALQQQKTHSSGGGALQSERVARDCLEEILLQFNLAIHEHRAHTRTLVDAVDSCLGTCLDVIEMQYPAREDHPVSVISLEHSSWEQEKPPDPCSFDSWLRSALPETAPLAAGASSRGDSWVMQQFLSKQPSMHRSASMRSPGNTNPGSAPPPTHGAGAADDGGGGAVTDRSERDAAQRRGPAVGYAPGTADGSGAPAAGGGGRLSAAGANSRQGLGAGVSTRSMHPSLGASRRTVTKLETRKLLTPEQEAMEEQLRGELAQRKAAEEMSRRLEQRDAEERVKLASLRKELKGKDYTYDHKGEVVILSEFDPERTPLEALSGPGYRVAGPDDGATRAASPKRRSVAVRSASARSTAGAAAAAAAAAGGTADAGGAAGAAGGGGGGGVSGGGLRGSLSPTEMRKERDRRLANDFKKMNPKTQPSALETLMPAGGVTLRGAGGATKSGPLRPAPAGITREAYAKQVHKKAQMAAHQQQQAAAAEAAGLGGTGTLAMAMSNTVPRDGAGGPGQPLNSYRGGAAAAAGGRTGSAGAAGRPPILDPLAAYGDTRYDPFAGARAVRGLSAGRGGPLDAATGALAASASAATSGGGPGAVPSSPDINLSLTTAGDWGAAGNGRSYEAPMALPHSKPTEKQLADTVGRVERLPRERAPLPTLAPPLSPLKVRAGGARPSERLQFHSVLAE